MSTSHGASTKYEALRSRIEADIRSGLSAGDAVPSERQLMETYQVSRMTARHAMSLLVEDGLVYRVQGSGTFVKDPSSISKSLVLTSFSQDITARGMVPGSASQILERVEADAEVASDLELSPGAPVTFIQRVRTADGSPMCLERVWVPADLFPTELEAGPIGSLYEILEQLGVIPSVAEQTLKATTLISSDAAMLGVAAHSAALLVSRVTSTSDGRPIERGRSLYRADRYDFRMTVRRRQPA